MASIDLEGEWSVVSFNICKKLLKKLLVLVKVIAYCYKLVQSFWVDCLFTGQFNTKGTFTDVI